ncbi:hypothetical protein ABZX95_40220 [Streptomyces sp. NPDC004232]|uniref:hypothetical protein n=1 Tax=Streptomyces sp. NPDC004232 TaxID=3154454 RepID=UPI0033B005FD
MPIPNRAAGVADLHGQHDKTTARTGELRDQVDHLTAALAEAEARLADLPTTRNTIVGRVPPGTNPDPPETNTAYQAIVNAFNQHPGRACRARKLHELGMPTDEAIVNVTRSRLGRLVRQGFLTQPGRGHYHKRI